MFISFRVNRKVPDDDEPTLNSRSISIVGGSVSGLVAAKELVDAGLDVTVFEEHREIGIPEKCDGLVSSEGMTQLGLIIPSGIFQNRLCDAVFFSPSMKEVRIDARKQNVIVMDRSRFDKFLAERAAASGAKIDIGKRVGGFVEKEDRISLRVDSHSVESYIVLDCSGYESYIRSGGKTVQAAQYLVYGNWFAHHTVEVYMDPTVSPGFFTWVIPISKDVAKIGMGGEGINPFQALDKFVEKKHAVVLRKIAAPIACFGTIRKFVEARVLRAGDAAGQAKPTTGGGIYTGGLGAMLAARAIARAVESGDLDRLHEYEGEWQSRFGREFRLQSLARSSFYKMSAEQLDKLFETVASSDLPRMISEKVDFDRHSLALVRALGFSNMLSAFGTIFANEVRAALGSEGQRDSTP